MFCHTPINSLFSQLSRPQGAEMKAFEQMRFGSDIGPPLWKVEQHMSWKSSRTKLKCLTTELTKYPISMRHVYEGHNHCTLQCCCRIVFRRENEKVQNWNSMRLRECLLCRFLLFEQWVVIQDVFPRSLSVRQIADDPR